MNGLGNDFAVVQAPFESEGAFEPGPQPSARLGRSQERDRVRPAYLYSSCWWRRTAGPVLEFGRRRDRRLRQRLALRRLAPDGGQGASITPPSAPRSELSAPRGRGISSSRSIWAFQVCAGMKSTLAEEMDTRGIELQVGPIDAPLLHTPGCVSMGNPHVVFFVEDAETAPAASIGPMIENHPLFPEGVNVGFCQIQGPDRIRLKVWERGAGLTLACGTGACAAAVASARRGLTGRFTPRRDGRRRASNRLARKRRPRADDRPRSRSSSPEFCLDPPSPFIRARSPSSRAPHPASASQPPSGLQPPA